MKRITYSALSLSFLAVVVTAIVYAVIHLTGWWFFLSFVVGVAGFVLITIERWYRETPPTPPTKHARLVLGKYVREGDSHPLVMALEILFGAYDPCFPDENPNGKKLSERPIKLFSGGNSFFWFYPWLERFSVLDLSDQNFSEKVSEVRLDGEEEKKEEREKEENQKSQKSMVDVDLHYEITWHIDETNIKTFLYAAAVKEGENIPSGRNIENIKKILHGNVAEAVRELAGNKDKPPHTWEEAVGSGNMFSTAIINKIMGVEMGAGKRGGEDETTEKEEDQKQTEDLARFLRGDGNLRVQGMGIKIKRLRITLVSPNKMVADEAVKVERERIQKEHEMIQTKHFVDQIKFIRGEIDDLSGKDAVLAFESWTEKSKRKIITVDTAEKSSSSVIAPIVIPITTEGKEEK